MSIDLEKLKSGDRRTLSKAITLIESNSSDHFEEAQSVLEQILPLSGGSIRIGISGVPGVGKSTFIESLGKYLISLGHRVAVLAVDPSSPVSGGSILGDKTRMEELSRNENAFVRPSPSGGELGGVATKTRETIFLCETAGYDVVLVETVGVGQSEYEVADMVDFFIVLMLPNAGDELQGIKKGLLELADLIVINKADGENKKQAEIAQSTYQNALHILGSSTNVQICSSLKETHIDDVWSSTLDFFASETKEAIEGKRKIQNGKWFKRLVHNMIESRLKAESETEQLEADVSHERISAQAAARKVINKLFS